MSVETATLKALVAHFTTGLGVSAFVTEGWPTEEDLGLDEKPRLTVSQVGDGKFKHMRPEIMGLDMLMDGTVDEFVAWAEGSATYQLDLWAAYRVQRDNALELVETLLENQLPLTVGLILSVDYYDQFVRFELVRHSKADGARGPGLSEWRGTWLLRADLRRIKVINTPIHGAGTQPTVTT